MARQDNKTAIKIRLIGSDTEVITTSAPSGSLLVPLDEFEAFNANYPLDFILPDINGAHPTEDYNDDTEKRNGLYTQHISYGLSLTTHVYPISNFGEVNIKLHKALRDIMLYPYTYFTFWYNDENDEYHTWNNADIIINDINPMLPNGIPTVARCVFTAKETITNDSGGGQDFDANQEYDLTFSLYGIWDKDGLITK